MKMKKYDLTQTSEGTMSGYYIGSIFATAYQQIGHTHIFSVGDECVAVLNFVQVEEDTTYEA